MKHVQPEQIHISICKQEENIVNDDRDIFDEIRNQFECLIALKLGEEEKNVQKTVFNFEKKKTAYITIRDTRLVSRL